MQNWIPIRKIKAVAVAAAVAALAAVAQVLADVDWTTFGVFGPAIGAALAAGVGYLVRETPKMSGGYDLDPDPGEMK